MEPEPFTPTVDPFVRARRRRNLRDLLSFVASGVVLALVLAAYVRTFTW